MDKLELQSESGQSTIEFALTLLLLMGFVLFYFQLALVLGFGNYVQYATFMSARAYLSSGPTEADQKTRATSIIIKMLQRSEGQPSVPRFPSIAKADGGDPGGASIGPGDHYVAGDRYKGWEQGVRYTFRGKLFFLSLSGRKPASKSNATESWQDLTLTSESWLGREPSAADCEKAMKKGWYYDNGC